jgi:uncharacterized protein (TIGR03000 family)
MNSPSIAAAALALFAWPVPASAQVTPPIPGQGGFGGGVRAVAPVFGPTGPTMVGSNFKPGKGLGGGVGVPGRHRPHFPIWGGYYGYGYPFGDPYYGYPYGYGPRVEVNVPVFVPGGQPELPERPLPISGESTAVLVLEFPAAAEVWVNGKKGEGDSQTEWTLSSPSLATGTEYTFNVKARWTTGGKTFEYERTVAVAAGNRSKALVIGGTEIKQ